MKEITDDSDAGRLEWMYKGPGSTIDSEEYLLGKAVTNTSTLLGVKNEVERDCLPTSLFGNSNSLTGNTGSLVVEQVDVARKLHEDPLLAIKKKEIEKREQLLKNPMKLKKLHDMLNKQMAKESDSALKSVKKKKKKKKKASRHSSSSEEGGIDVELKKRYKKLKTKLKLSDIYNMSDDDNDSESSEYDNSINSSSNKKYKKRNKKRKGYSSKSDESSNEDSCKKFTKYKNCDEELGRRNHKFNENIHKFVSKKHSDEKPKKNSVNYDNSSSEEMKSEKYKSSEKKNRDNYSESDKKKYDRSTISHVSKYDNQKLISNSKKISAISHEQTSSSESNIDEADSDSKRKYGLLLPAGKERYSNKKVDDLKHGRNDIRDIKKTINNKVSVKYEKPNKSVKLTEAEKEKLRKEMMQNAEWRNELRNKNIKSYKEKEDKEKKKEKDYSEDFYRKQLSYAASQGSVEGRIKSNINRIQRTAADMDKNFARR